jgi:GTP-binding protein HflX
LAKTLREELTVRAERAILVAIILPDKADQFDNLAELEALSQTAGATMVGSLVQKRGRIDPTYFVGKGKIQELAELVKELSAQVIIFDNDLTPSQIKNIEKIVECKVIDRSELILDIFATRAQSKQARLQVELAQLQYTYPRLTHMWGHLERIAGAGGATGVGAVGGIGTRGPGEKQLEIDRRIVRKKVDVLKRELKDIDNRKMREIASREDQFKICLVGYTNAGKSTLMNALTGADVYVEDKLFATLDTRTRQWELGKGRSTLLSDTVGFVRELPHHLIESFKATLEEAVTADLLLNVVDASNPQAINQMKTVKTVLEELGCNEKNIVTVFNKVDRLSEASLERESVMKILKQFDPVGIPISAVTGEGLELLRERASWYFHRPAVHLTIDVDCSAGKLIHFLRKHANIHQTEYLDGTARMEISIASNWLGPMRQFANDFKIIESSDPAATQELLAETNV